MKNRTLDLWDKYSKCDKQTIVIVAVLVLSAKLCKADGHFSQVLLLCPKQISFY